MRMAAPVPAVPALLAQPAAVSIAAAASAARYMRELADIASPYKGSLVVMALSSKAALDEAAVKGTPEGADFIAASSSAGTVGPGSPPAGGAWRGGEDADPGG